MDYPTAVGTAQVYAGNMKVRLWFFALALVLKTLIPSPLLAAAEVVIGYANISARVSPLWIAQEKGMFAKYGVNVQQVYMPGSPVMIASMSSGQVHLANSGGTAALGAAAGGVDLRVIGTLPAVFLLIWWLGKMSRVRKISEENASACK